MKTGETVTDVGVRRATAGDMRLVWEWANDPSVRTSSFHPEPISWSTHVSWFIEKLASPVSRIWILEAGLEPVGVIRYEKTDADTAEINFSIAKVHRGKGFGSEILRKTFPLAIAELGVRRLVGCVLEGNEPSMNAFRRAEYAYAGPRAIDGRACHLFERLAASEGATHECANKSPSSGRDSS